MTISKDYWMMIFLSYYQSTQQKYMLELLRIYNNSEGLQL